mgnify:CR=1 FL=1
MSTYYTISSAEDIDAQIYDTFILADGSDDRTLEMAKILNKKGGGYSHYCIAEISE